MSKYNKNHVTEKKDIQQDLGAEDLPVDPEKARQDQATAKEISDTITGMFGTKDAAAKPATAPAKTAAKYTKRKPKRVFKDIDEWSADRKNNVPMAQEITIKKGKDAGVYRYNSDINQYQYHGKVRTSGSGKQKKYGSTGWRPRGSRAKRKEQYQQFYKDLKDADLLGMLYRGGKVKPGGKEAAGKVAKNIFAPVDDLLKKTNDEKSAEKLQEARSDGMDQKWGRLHRRAYKALLNKVKSDGHKSIESWRKASAGAGQFTRAQIKTALEKIGAPTPESFLSKYAGKGQVLPPRFITRAVKDGTIAAEMGKKILSVGAANGWYTKDSARKAAAVIGKTTTGSSPAAAASMPEFQSMMANRKKLGISGQPGEGAYNAPGKWYHGLHPDEAKNYKSNNTAGPGKPKPETKSDKSEKEQELEKKPAAQGKELEELKATLKARKEGVASKEDVKQAKQKAKKAQVSPVKPRVAPKRVIAQVKRDYRTQGRDARTVQVQRDALEFYEAAKGYSSPEDYKTMKRIIDKHLVNYKGTNPEFFFNMYSSVLAYKKDTERVNLFFELIDHGFTEEAALLDRYRSRPTEGEELLNIPVNESLDYLVKIVNN